MEYVDYLRELARRFTQQERNEMAKVKFELGDAPKPRKLENGLIALRAPLALNLKRGTAHINLGIKCDHALILLPGRVAPQIPSQVIMPNETIAVDVAVLAGDELFETGETVLYAAPLGAGDFEVA